MMDEINEVRLIRGPSGTYFCAAEYAAHAAYVAEVSKQWLGVRVWYGGKSSTIVGMVSNGVGQQVHPVVLSDGETEPKLLAIWGAQDYFAYALLDEPRLEIVPAGMPR